MRLAAGAALAVLAGLGVWGAWLGLSQRVPGSGAADAADPSSPAPDAAAPDAAPLPPPEPEQGVLEVTLVDAVGPVQVWVTGLNVWPARTAGALAGQSTVRIVDLPDGEVRLWARTPTQTAGPGEPVQIRQQQAAETTLALEAAPALRGHVQSTAGRPLAEATATVLPPEPGMAAETLTTDAQGDFEGGVFFESVAHVWVRAEGHVDAVVEARPHAPLRVVLEPTRSVLGQVVDGRGEPVAGAQVWAEGLDGSQLQGSWRSVLDPEAGELGVVRGDIPRVPLAMAGASTAAGDAVTTGADGRFALRGLRPRDMRVLAQHRDYARAAVRVPAGTPADSIRLTLREGGRVYGTVRDPRGYEVPGIDVQLVEAETGRQQWTGADAHGEFSFEAVRGPVRVAAHEHGTVASTCQRDVEAGDALDCALTVGKPRSTLTVQVVDDLDRPVPGALAQLSPQDPPEQGQGLSRRRLTDPGGEAIFAALPQRPYVLELTASGFVKPSSSEVDVASQSELQISLSRAGQVAGSVVDILGLAVEGAGVAARGVRGEAETDAQGAYLLGGLPPGDVQLVAVHGALRSKPVGARVHADETVQGVVLHLPGRVDPQAADAIDEGGDDDTETTEPEPEAQPAPEPPSLLSALELTVRQGESVVSKVAPDSDAARAGFRSGDVVTHVDGEQVLTAAQARGMLRDPPGSVARVKVVRGGRTTVLRFKRPALR